MIDQLVKDFEVDGCAVLPGLLSADQISEAHDLRDRLLSDWQFVNNTKQRHDAVGDLVERVPQFALPILMDPTIVNFAEAIMGPRVQLDSMVLNTDPPVSEDQRLSVVQWHRDRFGFIPPDGTYLVPSSVVVLCYLQRMDDNRGPLRIIPGSHRRHVKVRSEERAQPHPDERLIRVDAGDAVVIHHNLLHSGTKAVGSVERRFLGWIYNLSALIHEDTFDGPNCRDLIAEARTRNDRRLLRMLGQDPLIVPRQNSGFVDEAPSEWKMWSDEDAEALIAPRAYDDVVLD